MDAETRLQDELERIEREYEYRLAQVNGQLEATRQRAEARRALAQRYGEDNFDDGAVIAFEKTLLSGRTYSYAAIRANGMWYTTGPKMADNPLSWAQLITWLATGVATTQIFFAAEMVEL